MVQFYVPWSQALDTADNFSPIGLARDIAALFCRIRQDRPWMYDVLTRTGAAPPTVNPLVSRFAWDRICSLYPPPAPTGGTTPFFGGQCPGVDYGVRIIDPDRGVVVNNTGTGSIRGPITSISVTTGPPNFVLDTPPIPTGYQVSGVSALGAFSRGIDTKVSTPRRDTRRFYFEIFRIDGLPDSCGNATYQTVYPPSPPANNITINGPIFGQQRAINISFPEYNTTNWPNFEWRPVIQFDGIRAEATTEGILIDMPDSIVFNPPPVTAEDIEQITNNTNTTNTTVNDIVNTIDTINNITTNIDNIVQNIQQILEGFEIDIEPILDAIRCYCGEENVTYEVQPVVTGTQGGVFSLPSNTVAVIVSGSGFDGNFLRSMEGAGSSPKVWFWGWYSACYGNSIGGERINLQYSTHSFPVAEGVSAVNLSCYTGTTANVVALTKELNCDVNG